MPSPKSALSAVVTLVSLLFPLGRDSDMKSGTHEVRVQVKFEYSGLRPREFQDLIFGKFGDLYTRVLVRALHNSKVQFVV